MKKKGKKKRIQWVYLCEVGALSFGYLWSNRLHMKHVNHPVKNFKTVWWKPGEVSLKEMKRSRKNGESPLLVDLKSSVSNFILLPHAFAFIKADPFRCNKWLVKILNYDYVFVIMKWSNDCFYVLNIWDCCVSNKVMLSPETNTNSTKRTKGTCAHSVLPKKFNVRPTERLNELYRIYVAVSKGKKNKKQTHQKFHKNDTKT